MEKIISDIETLPKTGNFYTDISPWNSWMRTSAVRVQRVFGTGSPQLKEVETELAKLGEEPSAGSRLSRSALVVGLINSMIIEISELWEDEPSMEFLSKVVYAKHQAATL